MGHQRVRPQQQQVLYPVRHGRLQPDGVGSLLVPGVHVQQQAVLETPQQSVAQSVDSKSQQVGADQRSGSLPKCRPVQQGAV